MSLQAGTTSADDEGNARSRAAYTTTSGDVPGLNTPEAACPIRAVVTETPTDECLGRVAGLVVGGVIPFAGLVAARPGNKEDAANPSRCRFASPWGSAPTLGRHPRVMAQARSIRAPAL